MKKGKVINLKSNAKNSADDLRRQDVWKKSPSKFFTIMLGVLLWIVLTILISPSVKLPPPNYSEGNVATKNVSAPFDFLVEDKASTEKNKIEAEKNAPQIYDFDSKTITEIMDRTDSAFNFMLLYYQTNAPELFEFLEMEANRTEIDAETELSDEERSDLKKIRKKNNHDLRVFEHSAGFAEREKKFQEILRVPLTPRMLKTLRWHHYRQQIREDITLMVSYVMRTGIIGDHDDPVKYKPIVLREIGTGRERAFQNISRVLTIKKASEIIKKLIEEKIPKEHKALRWVVKNITTDLITLNLTFNKESTERTKEIIVKSQKPVFFQVKKGENIVREGERITSDHLLKLKLLSSNEVGDGMIKKIAGLAIFVFIFIYIFWIYLSRFNHELCEDREALLLLSLIMVTNIILIRLSVEIVGNYNFSQGGSYYMIPYAIGPLLISILFASDTTIIFSIVNALLIGLMVENGFSVAVVALMGGFMAASRYKRYKHRSSILLTGFKIGLVNSITIVPFCLIQNILFTPNGFVEIGCGLLSGIIVAIFVSAMLPFIESFFHFTSDIKLLELADLNHPLLRELVVNAPGTYHHSIIVGNLSEEAADAIGANPLLARVGSYFHDIGKMKKPEYFIENQSDLINRHDQLTPSMSGLIISAHIKDGVDLALEYRLISRIINIIREHHGTGLITYFFNKAKENEGTSNQIVKEHDFRYPGPKPQTKESAIVLLADSVEATSRTLDDPTPSRLNGLVKEIINDKFMDGQLDNSHLTLHDLHLITESFVRILNGIFHSRIRYQKVEKGKSSYGGHDTKQTKENQFRPDEDKKTDPDNIRIIRV